VRHSFRSFHVTIAVQIFGLFNEITAREVDARATAIPCALARVISKENRKVALNEKCFGVVRSMGDPREDGINSRGREIVVSGSTNVPINSLNSAPCETQLNADALEHPLNIQKCREMSREEKEDRPGESESSTRINRGALGIASCVEHQKRSPRDAFAKGCGKIVPQERVSEQKYKNKRRNIESQTVSPMPSRARWRGRAGVASLPVRGLTHTRGA